METRQYFKQTVFPLMSGPDVNLISKFLVAEVRSVKEGCTYCRVRELNHVKFQNWLQSF